MTIDFNKLRKHTENELVYVLNNEELFRIKPEVSDRTKYLQLKKKAAEKKEDDITPFINFLYNIFLRDTPDVSEEDKKIVKEFIENNIEELITQTDIGFRLTTREKLKEDEERFVNAAIEKNLT